MKVHKYIFRIDYDPAYEMLDHQGKIARELSGIGETAVLGELANEKGLSARVKTNKDFQDFHVALTSLSGGYETLEGIALHRLQDHPVFIRQNALIKKFAEDFKIFKIGRIGFRVFTFLDAPTRGDLPHASRELAKLKSPYLNYFDAPPFAVEETVLMLDGKLGKDIEYKVAIKTADSVKINKEKDDEITEILQHQNYNRLIDFDLFEKNTQIHAVSLKKWMTDKWQHIDNFMVLMQNKE